jgi:hypothetical protein
MHTPTPALGTYCDWVQREQVVGRPVHLFSPPDGFVVPLAVSALQTLQFTVHLVL